MENEFSDTRQLINKILTNQVGAFEQLIKEYQRLVSHIVFRIVSNSKDREDLCQEVFIKIYQNLSNFHFESKLSTWIAQIAYNSCINYLAKKKLPLYNDNLGNNSFYALAGETKNPEALANHQDIVTKLKSEIEKLPVLYKTILTLYHLDEMSYNEIGTIMKLPEGTVKNYLFRARKLLKNRLVSKYSKEDLWM